MRSCPVIVAWVVLTILLVVYHVARGAVAYRARTAVLEQLYKSAWQRIFVVYAQDALLHVCATTFGSLCLYGAADIALSKTDLTALTTESAILMVSLGLLGIAGITGQLAVILASGELPLPKG